LYYLDTAEKNSCLDCTHTLFIKYRKQFYIKTCSFKKTDLLDSLFYLESRLRDKTFEHNCSTFFVSYHMVFISFRRFPLGSVLFSDIYS